MKSYTAHLKPGREPILVPEAFSWGALVFGPFWFAAHRAWIPAALHLALIVGATLLPSTLRGVAILTLACLAGLLGRDLVRWALERRGYVLAHVLAARDEEAALGRLLTFSPDVAAGLAEVLR